jgi:hypothetical protein
MAAAEVPQMRPGSARVTRVTLTTEAGNDVL